MFPQPALPVTGRLMGAALITNYGEYLEAHPPHYELEVFDNRSWSCIHGVERWRRDCGCNSGMKLDWRHHCRAPLREAVEWLRDRLATLFEREGKKLLRNPWLARDRYIQIILHRDFASLSVFLAAQGVRRIKSKTERRAPLDCFVAARNPAKKRTHYRRELTLLGLRLTRSSGRMWFKAFEGNTSDRIVV